MEIETYNDISNPDNMGAHLDTLGLGSMDDSEVDETLTELGLPLPDRAELARLAVSDKAVTRWKAVQDRFMPTASLDILARDENPEIRAIVARHPNVSREATDILAVDEDLLVRLEVAVSCGDMSLSSAIALSQDEDEQVRSFMVGCFLLGDAGMEGMANDPSPVVRRMVAMLTPSVELMRHFLDNDIRKVSDVIASNRAATTELLEVILERHIDGAYEDSYARIFSLANNEATTAPMLERIASSGFAVGREVAKARLAKM